MSLNVNREVTDAFYRYKMPRLMAKVEGKGNGIKTVIVNMVDVAKSLGRPPTYPTKFFGCELGAQTLLDSKNDRYIVNGSHEADKLQNLLDIFIKKFVLCPKCDNPETELYPNEKKAYIKQSCKACGHTGFIDMAHKLTTYILKNPPDAKPAQQGKSLTKKKGKGNKKDNEKNGDKNSPPRSSSPDMNTTNGGSADDDDDDVEWTVSLSKDAVNERMRDLVGGVATLAVSNDLDKPLHDRLEIFYNFCKKKKDEGILTLGLGASDSKIIVNEADRLDIKDGKAVMIIVELMMDENAVKQIQQLNKLLLRFTLNQVKAQKYLLGALEKLISMHSSVLMPRVAALLKKLYDFDIVEEEVFLEWGAKPSKKYVTKEINQAIIDSAKPFLNWLREADEESSEEESDVEIEYDEKAAAKSLKEQEMEKEQATENATNGGNNNDSNGQVEDAAEEGSDVDIDDI